MCKSYLISSVKISLNQEVSTTINLSKMLKNFLELVLDKIIYVIDDGRLINLPTQYFLNKYLLRLIAR